MVCPPYPAVPHGSVWYKGKRLNHTATASAQRYLQIGRGRTRVRLPLAVEGEVRSCEKVEIRCDQHYELDGRAGAYPDPFCLENGAFEPGQACEHILCPPFPAPANGEVRAAFGVLVSCGQGGMLG